MSIKFAELVGMGSPMTIVPIASNRLLALWWGLGAWQYADSSDAGASWSTPTILRALDAADASDTSENVFLRGISAVSNGDDVYFCFRHQDEAVAKDDGASPLVRVMKAVYSAGWTFTVGPDIRIGASNKRVDNHYILPSLRWDATNSLLHVLTARERGGGGAAADAQRWRLEAFNSALTSQYNSTQDETPPSSGRITAIDLGNRGSKLGVVLSFLNGDVKGYPGVVAAAGSYTTFPSTGTTLSGGGVLTNTERPILACAFDLDDDDIRVYGIASAVIRQWRFNSSTPAWESGSDAGTTDTMESIDCAASVNGFIFAQAAGFKGPKMRVNDDGTALTTSNKVKMPPGAELPFRALVRTAGPSTSGQFAKANIVTISDLVSGRVFWVEWDAVPLKPIDLDPPNYDPANPPSGSIVNAGTVTLKARYRSQEELTGKLTFEVDNDQNFGSIDFTGDNAGGATLTDQQMGQVTTSALAEGRWYWRVKGNVSSRGDGVYSDTFSFFVGANLENIRPEDGKAVASDGAPPTPVTLTARVRVLSGVTARAEFEVDTVETFDSVNKQSVQGSYVADNTDSSATVNLNDGVWFLRARAKTLTGDPGPWFRTTGFRIGTSADSGGGPPRRKMTREPTVSERGRDRINRIFVKIRNSAVEVLRESDPAPAANRRREHVEWLEEGDEAIAAQVAKDYLDAHSAIRKSVEGVEIDLTPDLVLDRKVRIVLPDGSAATWAIHRIEHDLDNMKTALTIGDYLPNVEEALARYVERLERTRAEDRAR